MDKILKLLPGFNCSACGYSRCDKFAEALIKNEEPLSKCKVLSQERFLVNKSKIQNILDNEKIVVDNEKIILKKYEPACIFCGNAEDVVNYKGKKYVVSTVNLIIEHYPNYFYETMVFNKETEEFLEYQERFETKNEAIINHNQIVENFDTFMKEIIIDTL